MTLKRLSDSEVINEVERQTNNTISRSGLYNIRQQIKKDSYEWYKTMREGEYEYLHEFKERINEIQSLQKKANQIIDTNEHNPQIQLSAISELHRLNITLSNYIEVLPTVINNYGTSISTTPEDKTTESEESETESVITV